MRQAYMQCVARLTRELTRSSSSKSGSSLRVISSMLAPGCVPAEAESRSPPSSRRLNNSGAERSETWALKTDLCSVSRVEE